MGQHFKEQSTTLPVNTNSNDQSLPPSVILESEDR